MGNELKDFFAGLRQDLQKVISDEDIIKIEKPKGITQEEWDKLSPEEQKKLAEKYGELGKGTKLDKETKKMMEDITKALDLTVEEGKEEEASPLAKTLDSLHKSNKAYHEILEKVLVRLENLEKALAFRKGLDGQDGDGDDDDAKKHPFDKVVDTALRRGIVRLT